MNVCRTTLCLFAVLSFAPLGIAQPKPILAATPPMGWNSWNHFAAKVTDADVRGAADSLVATGMRDAGYIYVNIDDTWEGRRDASGVLHPNSKFPDMKGLADYVHSKGLKLGIYSSPGPTTCGGYEGSLGHEEQDARMYAEWGIDYLKYDLCSFNNYQHDQEHGLRGDGMADFAAMRAAFEKMHHALLATHRPIVYSFCQYGVDASWRWIPATGGNLWRTTEDIGDNWDRMTLIGFSQAGLSRYAGPGHWNDPDMLEVGNGHMRDEEYRLHMTLWAMLAAPLIAGNDLTRMDQQTRDILMNKELIAIDQDALGHQGDRVWAEGPLEIWSRPLANGDTAVALFNRGMSAENMTLRLSDLGLRGAFDARDLWQHKDVGTIRDAYTVPVSRHATVILRLRAK